MAMQLSCDCSLEIAPTIINYGCLKSEREFLKNLPVPVWTLQNLNTNVQGDKSSKREKERVDLAFPVLPLIL